MFKLHAQVRGFLGKFVKNEQGVSALEYAIVMAGVSATVLFIFSSSDQGPIMSLLKTTFNLLKAKSLSILQ
ncbi:Flp family type IVb pilin [Gilliamella intestini]|uniref:Flp family type IVb pilin n=1 Tax=Gilliamella intestini TaxID=1798183 RepID=UPI000B87322A|nr:Flp family type IVb pilin [Gilliamella intestini]